MIGLIPRACIARHVDTEDQDGVTGTHSDGDSTHCLGAGLAVHFIIFHKLERNKWQQIAASPSTQKNGYYG